MAALWFATLRREEISLRPFLIAPLNSHSQTLQGIDHTASGTGEIPCMTRAWHNPRGQAAEKERAVGGLLSALTRFQTEESSISTIAEPQRPCHGPDKVFIVGNKITTTYDQAMQRARDTASPQNAKRAGYDPPCVSAGHCTDCLAPERVCNIISTIEGQAVKGRITLLIANESAGF